MAVRKLDPLGFRCGVSWLPWAALLAVFGGCSQAPVKQAKPVLPGRPAVPDAIPREEPLSRYGNPGSYEVFGRRYYPMKSSQGFVERGVASWYGPGFHRKRTSSGEPYDMYAMTAAHRVLPLPTYVEVTHLSSGRKAVVKVNDRGPFKDDRVLDLSLAAAQKLGIHGPGTAWVEVRALSPAARRTAAAVAPKAAASPSAAPTRRPPPRTSRGDGEPTHRAAPAGPAEAVKAAGPPTPVVLAPTPQEPVAVPATSGATAHGLFLQVGAFSEAANAERLRARIGAMLAPMLGSVHQPRVHIRPSRIADRHLYRVQIGPLVGAELVERIGARLSNVGVRAHRVSPDPL